MPFQSICPLYSRSTVAVSSSHEAREPERIALPKSQGRRRSYCRLGPLSVLIGANASGKRNVIDALRLLRDGLREDDFAEPINEWRGGFLHLAWKGDSAEAVRIDLTFDDDGRKYRWSVKFTRVQGSSEFRTAEEIVGPELQTILDAKGGEGWWRTQGGSDRVRLKQRSETACALAAAAADANFPARGLADFVREWAFFDPNPIVLRRSMSEDRGVRLDASGRNLALRLHVLHEHQPGTFDRIVAATRSVLGLPEGLEFRESDFDGRAESRLRNGGEQVTFEILLP